MTDVLVAFGIGLLVVALASGMAGATRLPVRDENNRFVYATLLTARVIMVLFGVTGVALLLAAVSTSLW